MTSHLGGKRPSHIVAVIILIIIIIILMHYDLDGVPKNPRDPEIKHMDTYNLFMTCQFPFKYNQHFAAACHGVMSGFLTRTGQQVFPDKMVTV